MSRTLEEEGYATHTAANGKQMLEYLKDNIPDLIILDFLLPDINGHELCKTVREESTVPILMITAHDNDANVVRGFQLGIDDFIAKPFNPQGINSQGKSHSQERTQSSQMEIETQSKQPVTCQFGPWTFISTQNELQHENLDKSVLLTEYEIKLLNIFCNHPEQTITREQLYKALESNSDTTSLQAINIYVYRLRTKINKEFIQSVRYKGYKFTP